MATPFKIKRSAVPGKAPAVSDLQLGELALNTYDAELYTLRSRPGIGTEVIKIGGASVKNVLYVNKNGDDENTGLTLADAKATIKGAVGVGSTGSIIKVAAGTYVEDNPIKVPEQISIVGDSLREVTISPQNVDKDLFHVSPGVMMSELTFSGTVDAGVAVVAFDPDKIQYNPQSPYIRFCTNRVANSIGLKVDGNNSIGPFKSMVTDSYTQYNVNGIGVSVSNEGYAQIVSLFTMNLDAAVVCHSGGQCDVTNSNSSFGNYGLIADGKGPVQYTGTLATSAKDNSDTFEVNLSNPVTSVSNAVYDRVSGLATITTYGDHGFSVGMGVSLSNLGFTCGYGSSVHTFVSSLDDSINITGAGQTTPTDAIYNPQTGDLEFTVTGHGLTAATSATISTATYIPSTGVLTITSAGHGLSNGDRIKLLPNSLTFTCAKDSHATDHSYPRTTDPSYNKWLEVSNVDTPNNKFDINVGSTEDNSEHWFKSSITNGYKKAGTTITIDTDSLTFTCAKDSHTTNHTYPRSTDPANNQILGIESSADADTFTVNVGIATHESFPDKNGRVFSVNSIPTSNSFTAYVGPNRFPHTYLDGGKVHINTIRPFDGKVVYFDSLYNSIGRLKITNPGSGYNNPPTITIDAPSTSWGVKATAVATLIGNKIHDVEMVSNGRGYTSLPSITFSTPDVGINTATATIELEPTYYSVKSSTPISAGICTITLNENLPYSIGVGVTIPFSRQSRILASSHSFQYIGSGVDPVNSLPSRGGVTIQENEVDNRDGGLVIYTSTDQGGNFRIGEGVKIDQISGTITGNFYSKSLFANVTPLILALGGDQ
tara:strand:+ start:427 stop:2904 length:2478 start_codon:yes stop_codon:yes gene_type:complete